MGAAFLHGGALPDVGGVEVLQGPVALLLSGGNRRQASTAIWGSTVLHTVAAPPGIARSIREGVRSSSWLDPDFVVPVAYGSRLVLRTGDLDGSLAMLERGHQSFPDDPWFPWLLGMQLWKEADRPKEAAEWLKVAALLDEDGEVHARAAQMALELP